MGGSENETVVCCFCSNELMRLRAAVLVVYPPGADEGESQGCFATERALLGP